MNVLSLFDGISCGQLALQRAGISYDKYFASEVDKHAIKVTQHNFPNTIQLGDVRKVHAKDLPKIDLLIGGSPCQGFSFAGKQLNFEDPRSKLFFEYVRLKNELNPEFFLLENVKMNGDSEAIITQYMNTQPVKINSSLFSAQKRPRIYWTNIPLSELPSDSVDTIGDILQPEESFVLSDFLLSEKQVRYAIESHSAKTWKSGNKMGAVKFPTPLKNKSKSLTKTHCIGNRATNHVSSSKGIRYLTPTEQERLQTLPDNYTSVISKSKRYECIGNGWTVDVITHILKGIKNESI